MKIIVDAFGGDHAPLEIIKGTIEAKNEFNEDFILTGSKEKILECAEKNNLDLTDIDIHDCPGVISMCDDAKTVLDKNNKTSMSEGFKLLNEGADAFVSAGSTGALTVGGTLITKRIKGIKRPCIASVIPTIKKPVMLADCGANAECKPLFLCQFAEMGSLYMNKVMDVPHPRVALANNGTEETKGNSLVKETYGMLKEMELNFIGNIEARQIPFGDADVVIADGFSGNLLIKMYEGVAKALMSGISDIFYKNILTKLCALGVMGGIKKMKNQFDYKEYGGAALLGLKKCVIKAHGSADARAFKSAIKQAVKFNNTNIIPDLEEKFGEGNSDE